MARIIFVRTGGTDENPTFSLMDAEDVKAVNGQNTIVADVKGERAKRTTLQNKAIHKYCSMLADDFNDAGLDMLTVLKVKSSTSWTMLSVKDVIWRSIQEAMRSQTPRAPSMLRAPAEAVQAGPSLARRRRQTWRGAQSQGRRRCRSRWLLP